jgi:hypothetical protein
MRTLLILLLFVLACFVPEHLHAQDTVVRVHNGWITGNEYKQYSQTYRTAYVIGVIDGIFLSPLFGARSPGSLWLEECVTGMDSEQITAIVDNYHKANPRRWHQSMHAIVFSAIREACPK